MESKRVLTEDGTLPRDRPFTDEELIDSYKQMARVRHFDERADTLQRQGKLGVYPSFRGQEAAQVGLALALEPRDWLVPSYRESAAALTLGLSPAHLILYWRAEPAGWRFPEGLNILPFYIPIATQIPQAAGFAHAQKVTGTEAVVATFVGDGGTSEGDFHEGLNFAAVFEAPIVFMVQNNGWAISVPTNKQMKNTCIADRAAGYGMPGIRVDGNDLPAVWQAAREAVSRARDGGGPTLIEAVTYRIAPHTTSDDPRRYRDEATTKEWLAKDPVVRLRRALEAEGLWDQAKEDDLSAELKATLDAAVREADAAPKPTPQEIVEHVFEEMTADQLSAWEALRGQA